MDEVPRSQTSIDTNSNMAPEIKSSSTANILLVRFSCTFFIKTIF